MRAGSNRGLLVAGAAALFAALGLVTLVVHVRRPASSELLMRVPRTPQLWLGEHWYIDGLKDDGQYMVPSTPEDETSGNALFDFGNGNGVPLAKNNGEPIPGHLPAQYWQKTGTSESHFPNEIYQFDIDGIRELEDGHVPWWERSSYYNDDYPAYRMDMGFIEGPEVTIDDGHVEGIEDNSLQFFDNTDYGQ